MSGLIKLLISARSAVFFVFFCFIFPLCAYSQINSFTKEEDAPVEEPKVAEEPRRSQNLIKGLKGTDSLSISRVTFASMVLPGYSQAYNKQYWKLPALYAGGAALIYGGIHSNSMYAKTKDGKYLSQSRLFFTGAGLLYLGSLIDGLSNYKTKEGIIPVKATLYSTLLPGLGQAYNGDYWKIPLIYGGFTFFYYWFDLNNMQYNRYRTAYNIESDYSKGLVDKPSEFNGRFSLQSLKNSRDAFRRNRDYAVLYIALFYAVNIIDATVAAQLSNFDVGENLAFKFSPAVIPMGEHAQNAPALGLNLRITMK